MNKLCPICNHPERAEIERAVFSMSKDNPRLTLGVIADAFNVSVMELKVHTLIHSPLSLDFSQESEDALVAGFQQKGAASRPSGASPDSTPATGTSGKDRLTDRLNMREGDLLLATANEYFTTLTTVGRRIKAFASDGSEGSDSRLVNFCTNALVNLYLGTGQELRKAIDEINALNTSINGSHDSASAGLQALATALSSSQQTSDDGPQFLDDSLPKGEA